MAEPLRVRAPSAELADALMQRLRSFPTELTHAGGYFEVSVTLIGNADRAIIEVLNGVDGWLLEHSLDEARVYVDDRSYRLTPPRSG
jgi:hypothetical protein